MSKEHGDKSRKKRRVMVTIGAKMIVIISLIIFFSLGSVTLLSMYYFSNDSELRIRESGLNMSRSISANVETKFKVFARNAGIIAENLDDYLDVSGKGVSGKEDEQKQRRVTEAAEVIFNDIESIIFVGIAESRDGKVILLEGAVSPKYQASGTEYTEKAIGKIINEESEALMPAFKGKQNIHNSSPKFDDPVLCMSIPFEKGGMPVENRIIVSYISLHELMDTISSRDISTNYIVNDFGDVIVHQDRSFTDVQTSLLNTRVVTEMKKIGQYDGQILYTDEDGYDYISSFHKVSFGDLAVIRTVKKDDAFQAVYKLMRQNIYIFIIVLCLSVIIVYFFSKTIVNPIQRLVAATKKIGEGNFNINLKNRSKDEIGLLTRAFVSMGKGLEERQRIKDTFGKFMDKSVAELILKNDVKLGGEIKEAVIFFSDIRSFTTISEALPPATVVDFLNDYMTRMVACINKAGGVVDKFIGDAIMAVWGTPVSTGSDTENAINAALMMRQALIEFNMGRGSHDKPKIRIGCGISTGFVLAGQIGSYDRMEYTVIGDAVNLASRIEALTKVFGVDILVHDTAYNSVSNIFAAEPMQKIQVKGKTELQQVYAIIGRRDDPNCPKNLDYIRRQIGMDERMIAEFNTKSVKSKAALLYM